ncbi:ABC transporter permease subunit OS=Streptomyces alboniger OX=132473 GN=CP975_21610 PE=3 SV=1 [Streptomyces alboniger]
MATVTASGPVRDTGVGALLRHRAVGKLLLLAVAAAVLVPIVDAKWASGAWPDALTVDLTEPLGRTSDWIIDNRDSHPLFTYFFGHVSNAIVLSVRGVYLVLLAAGWAGVTAAAGLIAWRVAGVRLAVTAAAAFAVCGLLGMWVPTMQTLALMIVAVLASLVTGALLGLARAARQRPGSSGIAAARRT